MTRIKYQTDKWGNEAVDHLEVQLDGDYVFITITDDCIKIHGHGALEAVKPNDSINVVEVRPVSVEELLEREAA